MRATLAAHAVTNMPEVVIVMGDIGAAATGDALVLGEAHEHFADFRHSQFLHSFRQNKRGPDTPDVRRVLSAFARQPPFSRRHRSPCGGPGGHSLQICAAMALGTQFRATARPCHRRSDWRWHEEAFALVFRPGPPPPPGPRRSVGGWNEGAFALVFRPGPARCIIDSGPGLFCVYGLVVAAHHRGAEGFGIQTLMGAARP